MLKIAICDDDLLFGNQVKHILEKISLHTHGEAFTFNGKLDELEQSFPTCFFHYHKSHLINLAKVIKYDKETAKPNFLTDICFNKIQRFPYRFPCVYNVHRLHNR